MHPRALFIFKLFGEKELELSFTKEPWVRVFQYLLNTYSEDNIKMNTYSEDNIKMKKGSMNNK